MHWKRSNCANLIFQVKAILIDLWWYPHSKLSNLLKVSNICDTLEEISNPSACANSAQVFHPIVTN